MPSQSSLPRLFLVAPQGLATPLLIECATAAAAAGDCACILLQAKPEPGTLQSLQALGLAVMLADVEARDVHHAKADGLHLSDTALLAEARKALKNESLGALAGISRHAAMEAAEAGADYVAFTQTKQFAGEPLIGWWQDLTDVPAVAFDPVAPEALATLLPQRPDFIRPLDGMWASASAATQTISDLAKHLK